MKWNQLDRIDESVVACIRRLMHMESGVQAYLMLKSLEKVDATGVIDYHLGIYYLEFGKIHFGMNRSYTEGKVSFRRARKHLKRAIKCDPDNSAAWVALGDSYQRNHLRNWSYLKALHCYNRAHASDASNARIVWCQMEANYMLCMYKTISELYEKFDWNRCKDKELSLWGTILTAYAHAHLGRLDELKQLARRSDEQFQRLERDFDTFDVAATCMLDLHYLAGEYQKLEAIYNEHKDALIHMCTLCLEMIRNSRDGFICKPGFEGEVLSSFKPVNLISHCEW